MLKISIILPTYNSGEFLEKALLSILNQTYKNIELIIVDGKSTDNTVDIIEKYQSNIYFWTSGKDSAPADAVNKALNHVTGDLVTFFGSDDYFIDNTALFQIAHEYETHPHIDLLFVNINSINRRNEEITSTFKNDKELYKSLNRHDMSILRHINDGYLSSLVFPGLTIKRSSLSDFRFDIFNVVADYDFVLHMWRRGANFHFIDRTLINVRKGGSSQTENRGLVLKHLFRVNKKYFGSFMAIKLHPWSVYVSVFLQYLHYLGFRPFFWFRTMKSFICLKKPGA